MLILGRVAALDVTQRWIRVYDAEVTQIFQCHQVLALTQAVQPAATKSQCAEVLVDDIQKMFSPWKSAVQLKKNKKPQSDTCGIETVGFSL